MAAPVRRDDELDLKIESLAYGGNGVARLNGFVVFVRRGLPGRRCPRAGDPGEAQPCGSIRARGRRGGRAAGRRALRALPGLWRLSIPGPRVRGAARGESGSGRGGATPDRRVDDPPLEPIVPSEPVFHYRNKLEYSFTSTPDGTGARLPPRRALGRGPRHPARWPTTDLGNTIREAVRDWARAHGLGRTKRPSTVASAPPRRAPGAQHGPGARTARHGSGRGSSRSLRRRPPSVSPRCARSTGRSTTRRPRRRTSRRGSSGATTLSRRSPAACGSGPAERVPADEHRDGRAALRACTRRSRGSPARRRVYDLYCGIGTIGLSLAARRADRLGHRGLRGVRRVRARERGAERHHERGVLRRRGRRVARGAPRARRHARRRRRRPAAAGLSGKALRRLAAIECAADRLRLLQPDDAGREREGPGVRVGLHPGARRSRSTCSRTRRTSRRSPS